MSDRIEKLENAITLLYWRIGSLPASPSTGQLWSSVKNIVSDLEIDVNKDVKLDGLAGEIQKNMEKARGG